MYIVTIIQEYRNVWRWTIFKSGEQIAQDVNVTFITAASSAHDILARLEGEDYDPNIS